MRKSLSLILVPVALLTLAATGGGCGNSSASSTDGGPGVCTSSALKFDLTVGGSSPVYYAGAEGSYGCGPSWLSIAPAGGYPLQMIANGCGIPCASYWSLDPKPVAAAPQSLAWDGTYYPDQHGQCSASACAAPGNYIAKFCVVDGSGYDAGVPIGTAPSPTCKEVPFVWPPTSADASVSATITPTPDGG